MTAAPTAPRFGEKPGQHLLSHHMHQAVLTMNQRQSRTIYQDPAAGMGVFHGFSNLNRAIPLVTALSGDLKYLEP